jgi:signal transduction histidine kinase
VVEDQGTGIPDDDLPHIFDPFFTRKSNGAGMGLSIARKVAEEHQWDIRVDNAPEGGVRVEVLMPAHCGEPTPAADVGNA